MRVFLLEEPSMKAFLEVLVERFFPNWHHNNRVKFFNFEGKHDMQKRLSQFVRNFKKSYNNTKFIILMDQDNKICTEVKSKLSNLSSQGGEDSPLIRIVCQSLESWYLGDLQTVEELTKIKLARFQEQQRFRQPDTIPDPKQTLKTRIKRYMPIQFAKEFGRKFTPENNNSYSFQIFYKSLNSLFLQDLSAGVH